MAFVLHFGEEIQRIHRQELTIRTETLVRIVDRSVLRSLYSDKVEVVNLIGKDQVRRIHVHKNILSGRAYPCSHLVFATGRSRIEYEFQRSGIIR